MPETIDLCDSDSSFDDDKKSVLVVHQNEEIFLDTSFAQTFMDSETQDSCGADFLNEFHAAEDRIEIPLSCTSLGSSSKLLGSIDINDKKSNQKNDDLIELLDSSDDEHSNSAKKNLIEDKRSLRYSYMNNSLESDDDIFGFEAFKKRNTKKLDSTVFSPDIARVEKRFRHKCDENESDSDLMLDSAVKVIHKNSSSPSLHDVRFREPVKEHRNSNLGFLNGSFHSYAGDSFNISFDGGEITPTRLQQGRESTGSVNSVGNVLRRMVPVPSVPRIDVNEIAGKLYPDLRNHFIRVLIVHAKDMRRDHYNRGKLDASIRAIVSLAHYRYPIRSPEAAAHYAPGVGDTLYKIFKEAPKVGRNNQPYNPPKGLFACAAAGALVALLDHESSGEEACTMERLLQRVNSNTHNTSSKIGPLFDQEYDYYLEKDNQDISWMQIKKLCSGLIRERKKKNASPSGIIYELSEEGRKLALDLKLRGGGPLPPGPLRQLAADCVDEDFGNITVSMDYREGGGGVNKLHDMCKYFDDQRVPYVVRDLKIADYVFFIGDKLAPVIIERKTLEDVAKSLVDGRWQRQQTNMRKAQYVLGGGAERKCHLCYVIEGDIDRVTVHGGYVGRRADGVTREQVQAAIESLPAQGFSVISTKTKSGSLAKIVQVAKEFLWRANNGSLDLTHTYSDFVRDVNTLSDEYGDVPRDDAHKNPAPPIVNQMVQPVMVDTNSEQHRPQKEDLMKLSMQQLKDMCKERCEKMTGAREELVCRLLQPRKPEILITRARRNQYVPKVPSSNAAILVALLLHQRNDDVLSKEAIMNYAEETCISKEPMHGNGKSFYNGWSGIKDLTVPLEGRPALVNIKKRKGYSLATEPYGESGVDVARAVHILAHRQGLCKCGQVVDIS